MEGDGGGGRGEEGRETKRIRARLSSFSQLSLRLPHLMFTPRMSEVIAIKLGEAFGLHDGTFRDVIEAEASLKRGLEDDARSSALRIVEALNDALAPVSPLSAGTE